ncbi:GxxExxY protein [Candidatus Sumerlaeota bacterium]|nr:GxxExxY protein [Candidatus Sumerlaeota bacterium]
MHENEITRVIVDTAMQIHRDLGPGLLESVYETILAHALTMRGLQVERQRRIPIEYDGIHFDEGFQADLIVEGKVIVELKSQESVKPVHKKQVLTYLRLTGLKVGLLINFGEALLRDGITRLVNGLEE